MIRVVYSDALATIERLHYDSGTEWSSKRMVPVIGDYIVRYKDTYQVTSRCYFDFYDVLVIWAMKVSHVDAAPTLH